VAAKSGVRGLLTFCARTFLFREAAALDDSSWRSEEESSSAACLTGLSMGNSPGNPPESKKSIKTQ
jgi:hypothetical protein